MGKEVKVIKSGKLYDFRWLDKEVT